MTNETREAVTRYHSADFLPNFPQITDSSVKSVVTPTIITTKVTPKLAPKSNSFPAKIENPSEQSSTTAASGTAVRIGSKPAPLPRYRATISAGTKAGMTPPPTPKPIPRYLAISLKESQE